jgi:hypothetical protein
MVSLPTAYRSLDKSGLRTSKYGVCSEMPPRASVYSRTACRFTCETRRLEWVPPRTGLRTIKEKEPCTATWGSRSPCKHNESECTYRTDNAQLSKGERCCSTKACCLHMYAPAAPPRGCTPCRPPASAGGRPPYGPSWTALQLHRRKGGNAV